MLLRCCAACPPSGSRRATAHRSVRFVSVLVFAFARPTIRLRRKTVGRAKPPARHFDVAQVLRGVPAVRLSAGNEDGQLIYLQRLDETQTAGIDLAIQKARSVAAFKRPTKVWEDALAGGRQAILALTGAVPFEGGIPLIVDGKVVGAVGASGGTSAQDGQVAQAGAAGFAAK